MKRCIMLCLIIASAFALDIRAKKLDEAVLQDDDPSDKELDVIKPIEIVNPPIECIKGTLYGCSSLIALYVGAQNLMSGLKGLLQESEERRLTIALRLIAAMALFEMAATKGSYSIKSFTNVFS